MCRAEASDSFAFDLYPATAKFEYCSMRDLPAREVRRERIIQSAESLRPIDNYFQHNFCKKMSKFNIKSKGIIVLVEFSVRNFRSIAEEVTLSMVKASGNELQETNTFVPSTKKKRQLELLRTSTIYGPNAAGKSNIIKALDTMQTLIVQSHIITQRGDKLPITPFMLDEKYKHEPSTFELIFIQDGVQYQYGFSADENVVYEEWLYAFPEGRAQKWFIRSYDSHRQKISMEYGSKFTGSKKLWESATRNNALYLSTALHLNSIQLQPVYDWFKQKLRVLSSPSEIWHPGFTYSLYEDEAQKQKVLDFLKVADLDIADLDIEEKPFDPEVLPEDMPSELREKIVDDLKNKKMKRAYSIHKDLQGNEVRFNIDRDESDGTKKFISFIGPWIDTLQNGYVLIIDELHDNFHPLMVRFLIGLFHDNKTNPKNAQLLFTSHETSLLSQKIFRRDQVWFCEKKNKATKLFSLVEFKPRKNVTDIEKAYLSGRYGALPFFTSIGLAMGVFDGAK